MRQDSPQLWVLEFEGEEEGEEEAKGEEEGEGEGKGEEEGLEGLEGLEGWLGGRMLSLSGGGIVWNRTWFFF